MERGFFHAEFIVNKDSAFLIDLNPRLPGANIPGLYFIAYEKHMARLACRAYLDLPVDTKNPITNSKIAMNRMLGLHKPLPYNSYFEKFIAHEKWDANVDIKITKSPMSAGITATNSDYFGEITVSGENYEDVAIDVQKTNLDF